MKIIRSFSTLFIEQTSNLLLASMPPISYDFNYIEVRGEKVTVLNLTKGLRLEIDKTITFSKCKNQSDRKHW